MPSFLASDNDGWPGARGGVTSAPVQIGGGRPPRTFIGAVRPISAELDGEIELTDRRSDAARSRPAGKSYRIDPAPASPNLEAMLRKGRLGMAGLILLRYGEKSWKCQRRVAARIEASKFGMDIRYVATSLVEGSAGRIYDTLYCARGQGREPDQAARGPARQRSHLVPLGRRQPDAADPKYRRLLAAVVHPAGHCPGRRARRSRVRNATSAAHQGRRPCHRKRLTPPYRLCVDLPPHPRSQRARAAQSPKPSLEPRKAPRSRRVEDPGGSRSP